MAKQIKLWTPSRSERHGRMRPTWKGEAIEEARRLGARGHRVEDIYEMARDREEWRKLHHSVRSSTIMTGRSAEQAETC